MSRADSEVGLSRHSLEGYRNYVGNSLCYTLNNITRESELSSTSFLSRIRDYGNKYQTTVKTKPS